MPQTLPEPFARAPQPPAQEMREGAHTLYAYGARVRREGAADKAANSSRAGLALALHSPLSVRGAGAGRSGGDRG